MEKSFAITPSVSIPRSKFDRVHTHKTAIRLGDIVPILVDEVLPGDTRSLDFASLIRMSTPIAPIMDDIDMELFAFFTPSRILFDHWKAFMGENTNGAGIIESDSQWTIPMVKVKISELRDNPYCIGQYMGLAGTFHETLPDSQEIDVSDLPLRGYGLIKNRWFRNQNVEAPLFIDTSDSTVSDITYTSPCEVASKKADYFTKSLPYAQKGEPVVLSLSGLLPVVSDFRSGHDLFENFGENDDRTIFSASKDDNSNILGSDAVAEGSSIIFGEALNKNQYGEYGVFSASANAAALDEDGNWPIRYTNLVAKANNAIGIKINDLRESFMLQRALEKDALYGTRYWEILYGHFGVRSPDATLQDPEFLGSYKIKVNVEQVLQTTGYQNDESSALGAVGANSVTGNSGSLFTKSFVEHGYLYVMAVARHRESYGQGISRMWSRKNRFDFYFPTFANLPAQAVLKKELYAEGTIYDDDVFGYQEAWAEYRYFPNLNTSIMNPAMPNSLNFWTLGNVFDNRPFLTTDFTKVNRKALSRALTTGENGPDFICDFFFKDVCVRPMPLYSIPGLTGVL